jgi:hypothetical protein
MSAPACRACRLHSSALITRERAANAPICDDSPMRAFATTNSILPARRIHRAGATLKSMLTVMCGAVTLLTAAAVLDPASLQARSIGHAPLQPPRDARREFTLSLASLMSQCQQVLAVNSTHQGRGCQIILWSDDLRDPGRINSDELAVVAHNPASHTVTVHTMPRDASRARDNDLSSAGAIIPRADFASAALSRASAANPAPAHHGQATIDHWLAHPSVTARVVSTGVQTMSLEPAHAPGDRWAGLRHATEPDSPSAATSADVSSSELSLFRLRLTWTSDSSDGALSASALVESGRRATFQEYQQ